MSEFEILDFELELFSEDRELIWCNILYESSFFIPRYEDWPSETKIG